MEQELKGLLLVDVLVIVVGDLGVDQYCSEEIHEHNIRDRVPVQGLLDACELARLQHFEELKEESFELQVVEDGFVIGFEENESEIGIKEELLQLPHVEVSVVVLHFETQD